MTTTNELAAARSNGRLIALWLLSGLVALTFLGAGGAKLVYAVYAAALLGIVMVGAITAEVTVVGHSALPAVVLLGLTAIIAYLRKP